MSYNRQIYDRCAYNHQLLESVSPGEYMLGTPNHCEPCFVPSPSVRLNWGASLCEKDLIDVDSELLGITRKSSHCPSKKYLPTDKEFCNKTHYTKECNVLDSENTRLSNPPCTLRCRGWNRWEWLCKNPQDNVEAPFDWNINNRIIVKNNHRPCIPKPLDQTLALPVGSEDNNMHKEIWCGAPAEEHPLNWRNCGEFKKY